MPCPTPQQFALLVQGRDKYLNIRSLVLVERLSLDLVFAFRCFFPVEEHQKPIKVSLANYGAVFDFQNSNGFVNLQIATSKG